MRTRSLAPELMDEPDVDPAALEHALRQLAFVNRTLGGYSTSLSGLHRLFPRPPEAFSFLDVGCGSGDTMLAVARWARVWDRSVNMTGIELSEVSARMARERLRRAGVRVLDGGEEIRDSRAPDGITARIDVANLFDLPREPRYDVVHAALVLHHMTDDGAAVQALGRMASLARAGIIVNDLHRHPMAHGSIRLLTRLLSRSEILRHDAPLSVRRSFTLAELRRLTAAAGLRETSITWHWAFRWLLVSRTTTGASADDTAPGSSYESV